MNLAMLALFLPARFAMNMAPGPNSLLSISNVNTTDTSCMAGVGRLLAFVVMIALASAGLVVVLQTSELILYEAKIVDAACRGVLDERSMTCYQSASTEKQGCLANGTAIFF